MLLFNIINEKLLFGALRLKQSFFTFFCPRFHKLLCQICESCFEQLLDSLHWGFFFFLLAGALCTLFSLLSFPFFRVPATFGLYRPVRKSSAAPFPKQFVCRNAKHPGNLYWEGLERSPETNPFCLLEKHTSLSYYLTSFTLTRYSPSCLFYLLCFRTHWHG